MLYYLTLLALASTAVAFTPGSKPAPKSTRAGTGISSNICGYEYPALPEPASAPGRPICSRSTRTPPATLTCRAVQAIGGPAPTTQTSSWQLMLRLVLSWHEGLAFCAECNSVSLAADGPTAG